MKKKENYLHKKNNLPKLLIIGAGLGGCYLADGVTDNFDITMIDFSNKEKKLSDRIEDISFKSRSYPILESGFGGSTKVWHNALMEIDSKVFNQKWPLNKFILKKYYKKAFESLAGISQEQMIEKSNKLKYELLKLGFPKYLLSQTMFIPKKRINAWSHLKLKKRVKVIKGEVIKLIYDKSGNIIKVKVKKSDNRTLYVSADCYVLSAGGMGSPLLLQDLAKDNNFQSLKQSGYNYEDHPFAYVGKITLKKNLYKFWNFPMRTNNGNANIRIPFSFYYKNINVSFQLRPFHHLSLLKPKKRIVSILSNIRNFPFNPLNYFKLFLKLDDLFEILSFKFGFRIPTNEYSILMIAEQPASVNKAIWGNLKKKKIYRDWNLDEKYLKDLESAIFEFLKKIKPITTNFLIFKNWKKEIYSSAHHSGTSKISKNPNDGVCDINGRVHGIKNLYICDGSIIPASGFVNTGLTIVALAKFMAKNLNNISKSFLVKI